MHWIITYFNKLKHENYTGPIIINFHKGDPSRNIKKGQVVDVSKNKTVRKFVDKERKKMSP